MAKKPKDPADSKYKGEGIYYDLPMEDYISDPCIEPSASKGLLNTILNQSPRHAWYDHPRLNPDKPDDSSRRADMGSAVHTAILGGAEIVFADAEYDNWKKKAAQDFRKEARENGQIPMLEHERFVLESARDSALAFMRAQGWDLKDMKTEGSMIWQGLNIWKRGRFDIWLPKDNVLVDVKTTPTADPATWIKQSLSNAGYDVQAQHYLEGIRKVGGGNKDTKFFFLLVEFKPPFCCSLVGLNGPYEYIADMKIRAASNLWAACVKSGEWPAYAKFPHWADPPVWIQTDLDARLAASEAAKSILEEEAAKKAEAKGAKS